MQVTLFYKLSYVDEDAKTHIFYIGRTGKKLSERFAQHQDDARKNKTPKGKLMNALAQQGIATEITEIARTDTHDKNVAAEIEDSLIAQYRAEGWELMNVSTGKHGGVPGDSATIQWTAEMLGDLGVLNNVDFSKKYNVCTATVSQKRKQLGKPGNVFIEWTTAAIALLGTATDIEVAIQLGISPTAVGHKRKALGIPVYENPTECVWTEEELVMLGRISDAKLAKMKEVNRSVVAKKRDSLGIPVLDRRKVEHLPQSFFDALGTMLDGKLGELYGVSRKSVQKARIARGIPPFGIRIEDLPQSFFDALGTMSDIKLGRLYGITDEPVRKERVSRGITSYRESKSKNP